MNCRMVITMRKAADFISKSITAREDVAATNNSTIQNANLV